MRWRKRDVLAVPDVATVVERDSDPPVVWEGHFTNRRTREIRLVLADELRFGATAELVVTAGRLGSRERAFARLKGLHGNEATLSTLSPWVPVNRRQYERHAAQLSAFVSGRAGQQPGRVLDVSIGGVALLVPASASAGVSQVVIGDRDDAPALPIRVVGVERGDDGVVLHARFGTLSISAQEYVAQLIGRLTSAA